MQDYILKSCVTKDKNSIACTDISNATIHRNYHFSLSLLEYPIFSLSYDKENLKYSFKGRNNTTVQVHSSDAKYGRATIKDADLLLYCISKLCQLDYEKKAITRRISFTAYDYLKQTGKTTAGPNYYSLINSLHRLASTKLTTNKTIARIKIGGDLGLIESFCCHKSKSGKLDRIEVLLPEWLFSEILLKRILTIDPRYLQLKPLEKRLYQLARIHCRSNLPSTEFTLSYFAEKVGTKISDLRKFKFKIKDLIKNKSLLDFSICCEKDKIYFKHNCNNINKDEKEIENVENVKDKEFKQQDVSSNSIKILTQKLAADQHSTHVYSKIALKIQVRDIIKELDRTYPNKTEAIFNCDILTEKKIYSYIKEFGVYHFLKTVKKNINFDFSSVRNPGGYLWKVMKNSRSLSRKMNNERSR